MRYLEETWTASSYARYRKVPPTRSSASKATAEYPASRRYLSATSPDGPAPMMATESIVAMA